MGTAGDVNADGYGDVIVAAVYYDGDLYNEGRAYAYYGSALGIGAPYVTICDEAHLLAALAGGGTVGFACSGTISLTAEIVIAAEFLPDPAWGCFYDCGYGY